MGTSLTFIKDLFFDVATQSTVLKGSQANTFPFGKAPANLSSSADSVARVDETSPVPVVKAAASTGVCAPASTVMVTTGSGADILANFNKCSVPKIAFGIFDGRTEGSFEPVGADFQHGSALNPSIITQFVCDQLVGKCNANQVAINDCQTAINATNGKSGQALVDAFNAAVSAHVA